MTGWRIAQKCSFIKLLCRSKLRKIFIALDKRASKQIIFIQAENRWKHVDPCEGIVDKPKVYDHGWKKKLRYVIAVSVFEVQDVAKRYVIDQNELKNRRTLVNESWLNKVQIQPK